MTALSAHGLIRLVAARLLTHPADGSGGSGGFDAELPALRAALAGVTDPADAPAVADLASFLAHTAALDPIDRAAEYTATFDTRNRRCLYLTWWVDGDTRRRGLSLVRLKRIYRDFGMEYTGEELPDFLPVALEFAARQEEAGTLLLQEHRAGLELLRLALAEAASPYAAVLRAVAATLPGPSPETKAQAKALAKDGPPQELVGAGNPLEPFGPGIEREDGSDLPEDLRAALATALSAGTPAGGSVGGAAVAGGAEDLPWPVNLAGPPPAAETAPVTPSAASTATTTSTAPAPSERHPA
ncbi:nitrate reductase molybdenum cofactor assembly chaperone [Streptomyces sp. BI20]|uniref:nitrate reductase molybdenum cofactor assembly chaperone n=1 Tax=Streptomyces sp. BI20 TaxID=3403460 RepID=UPI003C721B7F